MHMSYGGLMKCFLMSMRKANRNLIFFKCSNYPVGEKLTWLTSETNFKEE